MRIRTITLGARIDPKWPDDTISRWGAFLEDARNSFSNIEVQTMRLSTQPFESFDMEGEGLIDLISGMEDRAKRCGFDLMSVGPAVSPDGIDIIPKILENTTATCASAWAGDETGIRPDNIRAAAGACLAISKLDGVGQRNFMFASISNCPPDIPFFPAAYHLDDGPSFSIGMEAGDVLFDAFKEGGTLDEGKRHLCELYQERLRPLEETSLELSREHGINYKGLDVSPAPSLEEGGSVARAISSLLDDDFTSAGTLSACEMITSALRSLDVRRCGYSGLMLPVMEDIGLAEYADRGMLTISDLLSYSSVCGTGLDTVPVFGDVEELKLENTIRDMASLAVRLNKPLSARILPMVGIGKGERTHISSPYLMNCRVLDI